MTSAAVDSLMTLKNLGLRSSQWLEQAGINNAESLRQKGSVAAFCAVKQAGFHPSLNLLYALEGAIQDCHWADLDQATRSGLLQAVDQQLAA